MSQPAVLSKPAVEVRSPVWLTVVVMAATVMQVLDTTIANIALPQMTAGLSASQEEITWVLTSYIVAAAIATPLTGWPPTSWAAARFSPSPSRDSRSPRFCAGSPPALRKWCSSASFRVFSAQS